MLEGGKKFVQEVSSDSDDREEEEVVYVPRTKKQNTRTNKNDDSNSDDSSIQDVTPSVKNNKFSIDNMLKDSGITKRKLMVEEIESILGMINQMKGVIMANEKPDIIGELTAIDAKAAYLQHKLGDKDYEITDSDKKLVKQLRQRVDAVIKRNQEFYKEEDDYYDGEEESSGICMACLKQANT